MRFSRIHIENFRNFELLDVQLSQHAVIAGANKIGKSNLIFALRLLLDPSMPDTARQLREEDFWDGLRPVQKDGTRRPLSNDDRIVILAEFTDFEKNDSQLAALGEYLVKAEPMTARLTYVFQPIATLESPPSKESDFEYFIFGGDRPENGVGFETRRRLPLDVLPALRDAEGDLGNWRRSPLKPLLEEAASNVSKDDLQAIAKNVSSAADAITAVPEIKALDDDVTDRLDEMVGSSHGIDVTLGISPTDPERLIRSLRPFIDQGRRGISDASLGSANLLYLALKSLEFQQLVERGDRDHTFLAIEEPEAHLHPHLQRLIYKDFLRPRNADEGGPEPKAIAKTPDTSVLLTTHSPHIVSVAPLKSIVLLRKSKSGASSEGVSAATLELDTKDVSDLERYLDVTRGEMLFSRGVLLVEGDAECFVLPVLANLIGYNFDELGISVCSVSGTNFLPYVKLLGQKGLSIPFAVLTDYDPVDGATGLGVARVSSLLASTVAGIDFEGKTEKQIAALAAENGLFLNDHTFEIDLFMAGRHKSMCKTLGELTENNAAKRRASAWSDKPETLDAQQFLKDISDVSKGRFAQRLATRLKGNICPAYISKAIKYVAARCN